jgi:L,D-transpeptidase-like protein
MPHMERLTWDGIALHAGKLPGYPASHGCVRLPAAFAQKLYGITQVGTPVIVANDSTHPASVVDPGLLLGAQAKQELGKVAKKTKPVFSKSNAVTSILVSGADKSIYVLQNGDIVAQGKATIADPSKPSGRMCSSSKAVTRTASPGKRAVSARVRRTRRSPAPRSWSGSPHRKMCKTRSISA